MSSIEALCDIHLFLKGMVKLCRGTVEVAALSDEILAKIDETVHKARCSDFEDWLMSMTPWSPTREWKLLDNDPTNLPVFMENCKGPLCDALKKFLPNESLGEAVAVYAFIRMLMLSEDDEGRYLLHDQMGHNLDIADNDVVFVLHKFPDCDDPVRTNIDFKEIQRKHEILTEVLMMKPGFFTQSF